MTPIPAYSDHREHTFISAGICWFERVCVVRGRRQMHVDNVNMIQRHHFCPREITRMHWKILASICTHIHALAVTHPPVHLHEAPSPLGTPAVAVHSAHTESSARVCNRRGWSHRVALGIALRQNIQQRQKTQKSTNVPINCAGRWDKK